MILIVVDGSEKRVLLLINWERGLECELTIDNTTGS